LLAEYARRLQRADRLLVIAPRGLWQAEHGAAFAQQTGTVYGFDPLEDDAPEGATVYARVHPMGARPRLTEGHLAQIAERLLRAGGERGYCTLADGPEGAAALRLGSGEAVRAGADGPAEEGRALLAGDRGEVEVSWSPAGPVLEFAIGDAVLAIYAVAASGSDPAGPMAGPGVAWELPERGWSAARFAWAITAKSKLVVLVALRPEDSRDHGEEMIGAARIAPREEPVAYEEPLLSTEYDEAGAHTRATLELWSENEDFAMRGGGRRIAGGALPTPYGRLEAARFAWSIGGAPAVGGYEILTP
jgi:hypothetical protein